MLYFIFVIFVCSPLCNAVLRPNSNLRTSTALRKGPTVNGTFWHMYFVYERQKFPTVPRAYFTDNFIRRKYQITRPYIFSGPFSGIRTPTRPLTRQLPQTSGTLDV